MPNPGSAGGRPDDVTRRTYLAGERTYLAWWRTGLASLVAAIGAGRIVPALTTGAHWPYLIVGAGFAVLGIGCMGYAYVRHREIEEALARGEFIAPDRRVVAVLAAAGVVLGLLVLAIVVATS